MIVLILNALEFNWQDQTLSFYSLPPYCGTECVPKKQMSEQH